MPAAAGAVRLESAQHGRARFRVDGLYRNDRLARRIEQGLAPLPGVVTAAANPLTGRLLVRFDPAVAPAQVCSQLERLLTAAGTAAPPSEPAAAPPPGPSPDARRRPAPAPAATPWHAEPLAALLDRFAVAPGRGLSRPEARARLARHGPNLLSEQAGRSDLSILLGQLGSLPVALLGVSAAVSFATGGAVDALVIGAVVAINALIGFATERQAERIIGSLADDSPRVGRVLREGSEESLPAREVVPGDLLLLAPGGYVAADLRLTEARRLTVDESALTGESMPAEKKTGVPLPPDTALADRSNMAYMGTTVTGGSGAGLAVATGHATEIGRIQALMGEARAPQTPMQRQLDALGGQLVLISGAVCALVFGLGVLRGYGVRGMLKAAIALAVAAVPEGLPGVATTTLALGIARMRRRQVAVRHLDAVETLGAVHSFCLDKTGTLTRNRMSLAEVRCPLLRIEPREAGLFSDGAPLALDAEPAVRELFEVVALCNESEIDEAGRPLAGSPTEMALVAGARAAGLDVAALRRERPLLSTRYRSEGRPYMKTVHRLPDGRRFVAVKGSPAAVLDLCDRVRLDGVVEPLDDSLRESLLADNEQMAGDALRVLAVASNEAEGESDGGPLAWLGLVGLADPLRPGVEGFIRALQGAGVRTVMITGDQGATAYAIGRRLDLAGGGEIKILDASTLGTMDPALLAALVRSVHVFARVSPADKLKIVRALQAAGQVVAMTGDGINDGPALKAADIGVAMGGSGTDIARSVADVVVEDDELATLVEAIRQGRTLYGNIRKSVHYLLATNLSEIQVMLAGVGLGLGQPLAPMQLLWINLISDIFPGLALALEPPERDTLAHPPRDPHERIVRPRDLGRIALEATVIGAGALASWIYALGRYGPGARAGTHAFSTLALAQLLHAYGARSERRALFTGTNPPNRWLDAAVGGSLALQFAAMLIPGLRALLGVVPVSLVDALVIGASAGAPLLINEALKPGAE